LKFTIDQPDLEKLLSIVTRASEPRPMFPILGNVYLEVGNSLLAKATNIQLTIESWTSCIAEEEGEITLPAKELMMLVEMMDKSKPINFSLDEKTFTMLIKNGKSKFQLRGINPGDFPSANQYETQIEFQLPREALIKGLDRTLYASDPNATNHAQRGLSFYFLAEEMRIYGNTGYRIAQAKVPCFTSIAEGSFEVIIPQRSLLEIKNVFSRSDAEEINMMVLSDENGDIRMVNFGDGTTGISSQVIDGTLARDLDSFLPPISASASVNNNALRTALRRMSIFSSDSNNACRFTFNEEQLWLEAKSQERGIGEDSIDCEFTAKEQIVQTYNVRFMLDALDSFEGSENVEITLRKMNNVYALSMESESEPNLIAVMSPMADGS